MSLTIPKKMCVHSLHLKKSLLELMQIFIRHCNGRDAQKWFCIWRSGSAVSVHMEDSIQPKIILTMWGVISWMSVTVHVYNHLKIKMKLTSYWNTLRCCTHVCSTLIVFQSLTQIFLFSNLALGRELRVVPGSLHPNMLNMGKEFTWVTGQSISLRTTDWGKLFSFHDQN